MEFKVFNRIDNPKIQLHILFWLTSLLIMQNNIEEKSKVFSCEATLSNYSKTRLLTAVTQVVEQGDLYYSKYASWIQGIVCSNAHITLQYGLIIEELEELELLQKSTIGYHEEIKITSIKISKGYQNEYKVLYIVPEISAKLKGIISELSKFRVIEGSLPFKPHITICYLNNSTNTDYIIDNLTYLIGKTLKIEVITLETN
jgi:hypothetical protein